MGLIIQPPSGYFCPWNCQEFPTGQTPRRLYCYVAGIEKGPYWTPLLGEPPLGRYVLEQLIDYQCIWASEPVYPYFFYYHRSGLEELYILHNPDLTYFIGRRYGAVGFYFSENLSTDCFINGAALLSYKELVGGIASLQVAAQAIGVNPDRKTYAELWPTPDNKRSIRFARLSDGTCIYAKLNHAV